MPQRNYSDCDSSQLYLKCYQILLSNWSSGKFQHHADQWMSSVCPDHLVEVQLVFLCPKSAWEFKLSIQLPIHWNPKINQGMVPWYYFKRLNSNSDGIDFAHFWIANHRLKPFFLQVNCSSDLATKLEEDCLYLANCPATNCCWFMEAN